MELSQEELLKAIGAVKEPLEAAITNARVRRVRRVRNAEEDVIEEAPVEEEVVEEEAAEVGDTVVIEPTAEITGEIVEVVEEAPADEEEYVEEEVVEEPVQNRRLYRRIKNARIVRNDKGGCDVLVPVETKKKAKPVKNIRRYKTRTVTRNAGADGFTAESAYAKLVPTQGVASWATTVNKARKYDALVQKATLNATIDKAIDDAVKKALDGVKNCSKGTCNSKATKGSGYKRFNNYRRVRNEDGTISIDIALDDIGAGAPIDVPAPVVDEGPIPADSMVEDIDIVVDGRDVPLENRRASRAVRKNRAVHNEETEVVEDVPVENAAGIIDCGLDIPSTFPQ